MQAHQFQWQSFTFNELIISWRVIKLTLRRTFTTAHSSSDTRKNFLFRISHEKTKQKGYGQCGLPPKKKLCYLADVVDSQTFALRLKEKLLDNQVKVTNLQLNQFKSELFKDIPPVYFRYFYEENTNNNDHQAIITTILTVLYWAYEIKQPHFKAAISALEYSLLDFFAKILQISLTDFIFSSQDIKNKEAYSFYTLSYQKQAAKMIENALQFLQFTSYIKIKYVDDIYQLLNLIIQLQKISKDRIKGFIIDANASWKVESFRQFNQEIASSKYDIIRSKIMYIEQPFPIQMDKSEQLQWKQLKQQSKIKIMVDQSFSSYQQVQEASSLGNAINIKSQKAGGPINCIRSYLYAQKNNLEVMLGSMVSTHLGSNQTYCLYPLTKWLDVDGSLLVQSPDLNGGFKWGGSSTLIKPQTKFFGLEIDTNKLE